jgi:hypothetical protein
MPPPPPPDVAGQQFLPPRLDAIPRLLTNLPRWALVRRGTDWQGRPCVGSVTLRFGIAGEHNHHGEAFAAIAEAFRTNPGPAAAAI